MQQQQTSQAGERTQEIIGKKGDGYLWLHTSGDCILWPSEEESIDDDGKNAIGRWKLSQSEVAELIESGEVDDLN